MGVHIDDGRGRGRQMGVDYLHRADTHATSRTEEGRAVLVGDGININTGWITSLADGESSLLYVKNNEGGKVSGLEQVFQVSGMAVGLGSSANYNGDITVTVVRNPTAGTLVSNATAVSMASNQNFGSSNPFDNLVAYKGANGYTLTDGADHAIFGMAGSSTGAVRLFSNFVWTLPRGASIGVQVDLSLSSGTTQVYVALIGFYLTVDES